MTIWLILIFAAAVGLAFMVAGLVVLYTRRLINTQMFITMIKKLMLADSTNRALKLCSAVSCPAATLTFYLLGLEEPAEVMEREREKRSPGYRQAAVTVRPVPFEARAAALAGREVDALRRSQRSCGLAAVVGGLVACLTGLAASLVALQAGRPLNWIDGIGPVALLGALLGAMTWHRVNAGLGEIAAAIVPLLRPLEMMDSEARQVAAQARKAHARRSRPGAGHGGES